VVETLPKPQTPTKHSLKQLIVVEMLNTKPDINKEKEAKEARETKTTAT
jgi:hypothetical protein